MRDLNFEDYIDFMDAMESEQAEWEDFDYDYWDAYADLYQDQLDAEDNAEGS